MGEPKDEKRPDRQIDVRKGTQKMGEPFFESLKKGVDD